MPLTASYLPLTRALDWNRYLTLSTTSMAIRPTTDRLISGPHRIATMRTIASLTPRNMEDARALTTILVVGIGPLGSWRLLVLRSASASSTQKKKPQQRTSAQLSSFKGNSSEIPETYPRRRPDRRGE